MSRANPPAPPVWAERLLEWYCDPYVLEDLQGDLYERFHARIENVGLRRAQILYVWDVIRFMKLYIMKKQDHPAAFIHLYKSYAQIALRHLLKHKVNTAITISGLTMGIACFMLIMLYVQDEALYDKHYDKADRIYRVTTNLQSQTTNEHVAWTDAMLGASIRDRYPEVEETVGLIRIMGSGTSVRSPHGAWREENMYRAENSYFKVFSHTWIKGDPKKALAQPNSIVLTQSLAGKYFPDQDAFQQTLTLGESELMVTGIIEDLPDHTDLRFDALVSMANPLAEDDEWCTTYILFTGKKKANGFAQKLDTLYHENLETELNEANAKATYELEALTDVHFGERKLFDSPKSNRTNQYIFTAVAIGILLIAAINYVNLSVARMSRRILETGIRKAMGALRSQLQAQYLTEAVIVATASLVLATGVTLWLLPVLNNVAGKHIPVSQLFSPRSLPVALAIIAGIGLLAGSYPAFRLTRGSAVTNLKNDVSLIGRSRLQHILIIVQFTASITLMVCSYVVYDQVQLLTDTSPGFNKDQTLVVDIPKEDEAWSAMHAFKNTLAGQPLVKGSAIAGFNSVPASDMDIDTYEVMINGHSTTMPFNNISVDQDYLSLLGIEVTKGRNFTTQDLEANDAVIVNEAFVRRMGWEHPLDQKLFCGDFEGRIIGVIKDFHFSGLHKTIEPLVLHGNDLYPDKLLIKLSKADFNTITALEKVWRSNFKDQPFNFEFLDLAFNSQYHSEQTLQTILLYFSALTIVVACLGLFGLIAILAARKTKEFGIRKVFGASRFDLTLLLWKPFLVRIVIAAILSIPLTVFGMEQWLQRFSSKASIGAIPFIMASAGACVLAMIAMSYHSFQTARTNPITSIKHE